MKVDFLSDLSSIFVESLKNTKTIFIDIFNSLSIEPISIDKYIQLYTYIKGEKLCKSISSIQNSSNLTLEVKEILESNLYRINLDSVLMNS